MADAADRMVRLLRELASPAPGETSSTHERAELARRAAAAGIVLLKNESSVLPIEPSAITRVLVTGPAADRLCPQGGGASEVTPPYVRSPLETITARAGSTQVAYHPGCVIPGPVLPLGPSGLRTEDGEDGIAVEYFVGGDMGVGPVHRDVFTVSRLVWLGAPHPDLTEGDFSARATTVFTPDQTGTWDFGLIATGVARLSLDGRVLLDTSAAPTGEGFFGLGTEEVTAAADLVEGTGYTLTVEFRAAHELPIAAVSFGGVFRPPDDAVSAAAGAARTADMAIVVVGTDSRWETEGKDRTTLQLPGDQDALIRAVAAANSRTIVVVNSGAPVEMPWADDVMGIVQVWFAGQEGGTAVADVLFGDVDASGRLPTTFPVRLEDSPAFPYYPGDGQTLHYGEGILVGYRHYDTKNVEPRFCFGHGLSYTTFSYGDLVVRREEKILAIEVTIENTGERPGAEVVQAYVRRSHSLVERPDKELKAFEKLWLAPGETAVVHLDIAERDLCHWEASSGEWVLEPGEAEILVGSSSRQIRLTATMSL